MLGTDCFQLFCEYKVHLGLALVQIKNVLGPYRKLTGAYDACRSGSSIAKTWGREAHQALTVSLGQHPCSSDGPASSPLGLVRRVRLLFTPSRCLVRQGKVDSVMFCLSCSRKDCWMLRNLNVRMNWPGQRLAAYVSRAKWSTYQKQIASSSSALQGNNF